MRISAAVMVHTGYWAVSRDLIRIECQRAHPLLVTLIKA